MTYRRILLPLLFSAFAYAADESVSRAFITGANLTDAAAASLESALAGNPEDAATRAQLLGYYTSHDTEWSNRYRLLSWVVEHHPESSVAALQQLWRGMPAPVFDQLKPLWVAEVHQHADDAQVLSNASLFLNSKNMSNAPTLIRVGANVQQANLIQSAEPVYPPLAKQARVQGTVRFNVTIGKDGLLTNAQLVSGHPLLVAAAQQALMQYVYKPTLLNGKPVDVTTTVDINFTLN